MQIIKSVAGPNPYVAATGAVVTFGEMEKVNSVVAKISNGTVLAVADTLYALRVVITGNVVNVLVDTLATGGGGQIWTELAAGDLHLLTFTVIADGE